MSEKTYTKHRRTLEHKIEHESRIKKLMQEQKEIKQKTIKQEEIKEEVEA